MTPHIYLWKGRWWVTRNGPDVWRSGRCFPTLITPKRRELTLNDVGHHSFAAACRTAKGWHYHYAVARGGR
jgi:hypothetical protein